MKIRLTRRAVVKSGAALAGSAVFSPALLTYALGETPIKVGMHDPLTGTYAAEGESETRGAKMALAEINAKGGMLGRRVDLVIEDDNANAGLAAQKALKLIEQDKVDLLMGAVSSATALSVNQVAHDKKMVYMVTGGHTDPVTGSQCHWTTFRICTTTYMLAAGLAATLYKKFGGKWYFITPDYAFGHTLQESYAKLLKQMGGTVLGNSLAPLGTTDFTSYLIKAQQSKPDVLINLCDGQDLVNSMKQAAQFGLMKKFPIGGGLSELEVLRALPKDAKQGWWTLEWWWDQPNTPHVKEWVAAYRKAHTDGTYPSARTWFGYAGLHSLALGVAKAKSVEAVKVAHALEGLELPPEVKLQPNHVYFRAGDHQLMSSEFPGQIIQDGVYPHLFKVADIVPGDKIALSVKDTGCKLDYQS
ncbi:MAG TPA: ABC transporter substrate-binding protein [Pseudolabrys sp.]|jgi:branched-chain amino acid transport system substrate-binding protein|uniref:ABC transporter substrate-binding protein n=1 Tax=Pseudolabrys sp. TaxID=1960880 RepID=UPI002DDCEAAC|nr:ABC transporter substrate-binding protein [Pseudolabrys sp.]HEV2631017.1 ABC transporter substrate-binding protein [Pseudolabrys sp.]